MSKYEVSVFADYVECDVCDKRVDHEDDQSGFCSDCGCCLEHCQCSTGKCFGEQNTGREPSADDLLWD